jgi:hypothetical protein
MGTVSADQRRHQDLDIPRYWQQAPRLRLPTIQYTAREFAAACRSGPSSSSAKLRPARSLRPGIQGHLDRYGISLRDLVWQTKS